MVQLRGQMTLRPASEGGLPEALPDGSRSLLFRLAELGTTAPDSFGAVVRRADSAALEPGSTFEVRVLPWAEGVEALVSAGDRLPVWHGRDVGVLEVAAVDVPAE